MSEEDLPPPPEPTIDFKEVKTIEDTDDLSKVQLKKVKESEKHYVSMAEMVKMYENQVEKEIFSKYTDDKYQKEYYDTETELEKKIQKLSNLVKKSKNIIFFTGAGISTSAGIPDFRGPEGEWTLLGSGKKRKKKPKSFINAFPTLTHMSILQMMKKGKCKYLISQNCDGLHLKSGVKRNMISELHGNCNIEYCENCGKEYYRDFYCRRKVLGRDHFTGRFCDQKKCGEKGRLMNSTIDFEQGLPMEPLKKAWSETAKCDLMIVLGSSLLVNPAALMPKEVLKKKRNVVIVNLQRTPLWNKGALNIHAKIDVVMERMMKNIKMSIPKWEISRKVKVSYKCEKNGKKSLIITDNMIQDNTIHHCTYVKEATVMYNKDKSKKIELKDNFRSIEFDISDVNGKEVKVILDWMKHYDEPCVGLVFKIKNIKKSFEKTYDLLLDPYKLNWKEKKGLIFIPKSK